MDRIASGISGRSLPPTPAPSPAPSPSPWPRARTGFSWPHPHFPAHFGAHLVFAPHFIPCFAPHFDPAHFARCFAPQCLLPFVPHFDISAGEHLPWHLDPQAAWAGEPDKAKAEAMAIVDSNERFFITVSAAYRDRKAGNLNEAGAALRFCFALAAASAARGQGCAAKFDKSAIKRPTRI